MYDVCRKDCASWWGGISWKTKNYTDVKYRNRNWILMTKQSKIWAVICFTSEKLQIFQNYNLILSILPSKSFLIFNRRTHFGFFERVFFFYNFDKLSHTSHQESFIWLNHQKWLHLLITLQIEGYINFNLGEEIHSLMADLAQTTQRCYPKVVLLPGSWRLHKACKVLLCWQSLSGPYKALCWVVGDRYLLHPMWV